MLSEKQAASFLKSKTEAAGWLGSMTCRAFGPPSPCGMASLCRGPNQETASQRPFHHPQKQGAVRQPEEWIPSPPANGLRKVLIHRCLPIHSRPSAADTGHMWERQRKGDARRKKAAPLGGTLERCPWPLFT